MAISGRAWWSAREDTSVRCRASSGTKLLRPRWSPAKSSSRCPPRKPPVACVAGDLPELYFCRDLRGYGWCFRKQDVLTVGIGRMDNHGLSQQCDDFIRFLKRTRNVEVPGKGILGHAYWLYGHSERTIVDDAILLIGDAAGLAYPESGEGIRPAIESGLIAAHMHCCRRGQLQRQPVGTLSRALAYPLASEAERARIPQPFHSAIGPRDQRASSAPQPFVLPQHRL